MSTFRCEFLGCKVNQYDAERARRHLLEQGWRELDDSSSDSASLLVLAGCTVTSTAARRGRQAVRSALRQRPDARIAVLGCVSEEDRRFYASLGSAVTLLPSAREDDFLSGAFHRLAAHGKPPSGPAKSEGTYRPRRTRAYLKVEDGCDLNCAYCIIPSVRGRARSRSPDAVEKELRQKIQDGVREVVLTGIHLGHYGRRSRGSLDALVRRLLEVPGDWRLRLSSLEVTEISPELLELLEHHPRLVPHLHLPLQSGSPRILRRMRRPYTVELFRRMTDLLRERLPDPALTTDVIVGFPGEEAEDFRQTLEMCDSAAFSKIHLFPFSPREGTEAERMPDRVHGSQVKERKALLFALESRHREASLQRRVGQPARIVVERTNEAGAVGVDERYHRTVLPPSSEVELGELVDVTITAVRDGALDAMVGSGVPR